MPIRKSSLSGIPFGTTANRPSNPSAGQPYFNGDIQRLELYTGSTYGWQNIVAVSPTITSYTGSLIETNTTNTISITGTGFATGAVASLIGVDNTEYVASSTTVNNLTSITAVFGSIPANNEPYDIKVTNPTTLYAISYDVVSINDRPVWQTSSGSLGTFDEGSSISVTVSATDEENNTITYTLSSGSLPTGLSLNSSTGVISGTISGVSATTTYSFSITASDGINTAVSRSFSITVNSILTWNTASGSLGTITEATRSTATYTLSATGLGNTLTYSIISGSLPSGMSLNSSTGVISGPANSVVTNTTSTFTASVTDGTLSQSRSFSITVNAGTTQTFDSTGASTQSWTAPAGITAATFHIWGAGGGGANGGTGGYTTGTYTVVAGRSYNLYIGRTGVKSAGGGGWPGGGSGGTTNNANGYGWGGGGYSAIQDSTNNVYLAIAGAGGGAAAEGSAGATGGGTTGGNISNGFGTNTGGTQSAGGTAGITIDTPGGAGSSLTGGTASNSSSASWSGGGGGGAGYYGGASGETGGGAVTGGAGGSGYVNTSYTSNGSTIQGVGTYSGRGTAGNANTNGRIIIIY